MLQVWLGPQSMRQESPAPSWFVSICFLFDRLFSAFSILPCNPGIAGRTATALIQQTCSTLHRCRLLSPHEPTSRSFDLGSSQLTSKKKKTAQEDLTRLLQTRRRFVQAWADLHVLILRASTGLQPPKSTPHQITCQTPPNGIRPSVSQVSFRHFLRRDVLAKIKPATPHTKASEVRDPNDNRKRWRPASASRIFEADI